MTETCPAEDDHSSLLGRPSPDFTLTSLEGRAVSLSDFTGKVVILNFWATGCGACVFEIPYFIEMQKELAEKGFAILGISTDDDTDLVREFVGKREVNYPVMMASSDVKAMYCDVQAIPTTFVLDKDGVIQRRYVGVLPPTFRSDVEALLAGEELSPPVDAMPEIPKPQPFSGVVSIQPLGVQIGATLENPSDPGTWNRIGPFWAPPPAEGTTLSLLVAIPAGGIVMVDEAASAVTHFSDDAGKDLLVSTLLWFKWHCRSSVELKEIQGANREYVTVLVGAIGRPSENATSVSTAGDIALLLGGGTATYESPSFMLCEEQTFTLGELSCQWMPNNLGSSISAPIDSGGNLLIGTMITRGAQAAHDAILETQWLSETGSPISAKTSGGLIQKDGDFWTTEKSYGFPAGVETAKMVVTAMTDTELVAVPFDITTKLNGSGLASEGLRMV